MLIAARNGFLAGGKLSAKSYIQDGLVAMWDGIENAGWGVHDASAIKWKDLSGNGYDAMPYSGNALTWDANSIYSDSSVKRDLIADNPLYGLPEYTFETVTLANEPLTTNYGFEVCTRNSNTSYLQVTTARLVTNANQYYPIVPSQIAYDAKHHIVATVRVEGGKTHWNTWFQGKHTDAVTLNSTSSVWRPGVNTQKTSFLSSGPAFGSVVYGCYGHVFAVRCYSRALTADEIAANYAVDKVRFNLP